MPLSTFAFLHPLSPAQLQVFRAALPGVEFVGARDNGLPPGLERAAAAALSWNGPPIDDVLAAAPRLRWLHQRGAGIDRIATASLLASDVVVTNGSGNHAINISEHVIGLMLAFARQLPALLRAQDARRWQPPEAASLFELSGQTLAVIGAGALGRAVGERAAAFGMRVHGVRRTAAGSPLPPGFSAMTSIDALDDALRDADHVVITLPLTAETRHLFAAERLAAMKRGAYLYNVGRGAIVEAEALLEALRSGHLAGAGLDVTDPEPLPAESPLWGEPGVIVTAHSSGLTPRSYERYEALLLDNLRRFDGGQALLNVVDKARGY
ncbi:MAG: D-2-hydroxyacid dehydrogenase [Caldimonas sp.]